METSEIPQNVNKPGNNENRPKRAMNDNLFVYPTKKTVRDPRLEQFSPVSTNNMFEPLSNTVLEIEQSPTTDAIEVDNSVQKVPPIYISGITSYEKLIASIKAIANGVDFKCKSTRDEVIVHPSTPTLYRSLVHSLKKDNVQFHTFQLPEDRVHRVVLRGIHHSTPTESIRDALLEKGYDVKNVSNVISRDKFPLPLFFLDFDRKSTCIESIYKLTTLLHSIVSVEELRRHKAVVQCTRCQRFNHTKAFCNHQARCVKCAGNHHTSECQKNRVDPATCALCGNQHTANYRGCMVFQDLQNQRRRGNQTDYSRQQQQQNLNRDYRHLNHQQPLPQQQQQQQQQKQQQQQQRDHLQLGEQPRQQRNIVSHHSSMPTTSSAGGIYKLDLNDKNSFPSISNRHEDRNFRPAYHDSQSYASKVRDDHRSTNESLDSLTGVMQSFLSDIKSLVFPLMSLLTQLTQALLTKNGR
jgi:hypothetical protein